MSLREGQVAQEVLVYPNPATVRIQLNGYATDNLVIVITNAIGQVVYNNSMSVRRKHHCERDQPERSGCRYLYPETDRWQQRYYP